MRDRAGFTFSNLDFEKLSNWPLWNGKDELPIDSVVAVGYTWMVYEHSGYSLSLTSNLLFVILLALGSK